MLLRRCRGLWVVQWLIQARGELPWLWVLPVAISTTAACSCIGSGAACPAAFCTTVSAPLCPSQPAITGLSRASIAAGSAIAANTAVPTVADAVITYAHSRFIRTTCSTAIGAAIGAAILDIFA
jgi:hypothetical protein